MLTFFDRRKGRLDFVDIRSSTYDPAQNGGVAFADAMRHFHVITGGTVRNHHTTRYTSRMLDVSDVRPARR